jgi:hypothetical protein
MQSEKEAVLFFMVLQELSIICHKSCDVWSDLASIGTYQTSLCAAPEKHDGCDMKTEIK